MFAPGDTTCAHPLTPAPSSGSLNGSGDATSGNFTTTAAGTYRWVAHYAGDANNNPVDGACNAANESSAAVDANIVITPATAFNVVGDPHVYTATVKVNDGTGFAERTRRHDRHVQQGERAGSVRAPQRSVHDDRRYLHRRAHLGDHRRDERSRARRR